MIQPQAHGNVTEVVGEVDSNAEEVGGGPCKWKRASCTCGAAFRERSVAAGHHDGKKHIVLHEYDLIEIH